MPFFASFATFSLLSLPFPLLFLSHWASSNGQFVRWNAPTVPTADIFFSPCTFPMIYPFGSRAITPLHQQRKKLLHLRRLMDEIGGTEDDSLCHTKHQNPFICDLHRALSISDQQDALRLARVYQKHAAVLHENASSSPTFVVLIVRQLAQPISPAFVTRNSTEFGCLFRFMCGTMSEEIVHKFVRSTKVFMRLYAHVLLNRWSEHRTSEFGAHCPMILAIVLLEGLIINPKRISSVTLHTDNADLFPFLVNAQNECTNMLLQGNRLVDVLIDLTNRVGFAVRDFHSTKGMPRRHTVPKWAWAMAVVALSLAFLALMTEWVVVRRVRTKKMRTVELGGIKAVIKSKTHMIF